MRTSVRTTLIMMVALLAGLCSGAAIAQRHGSHAFQGGHAYHGGARASIGFYFGVPSPFFYGPRYYRPYYYPAPYYYVPYYPKTVVVPSAPPVYVVRAAPQAAQRYWYYCAGANAYYPYVRKCPPGWQRVSPQPPG